MPLVLDDFLVHFDDQRTAAALRLLARLSAELSMQIIVFTHHDHVLHLASEHIPGLHHTQILNSPGEERLPSPTPRARVIRPAAVSDSDEADEPDDDSSTDAVSVGSTADRQDERILAVLLQANDWLAKAAIQAGIERTSEALTAAQWQVTIKALEDDGRVISKGKKRGKRYALPDRANEFAR